MSSAHKSLVQSPSSQNTEGTEWRHSPCWLLADRDSPLCRHRHGHLCYSSEARRPFLGSNHRLHLSHRRRPLHDGEFDPTHFYICRCLLAGLGVVAGFCICVCGFFVFVLCELFLLPPWLCHRGSALTAPLLPLGAVCEAGRAEVGLRPLLLCTCAHLSASAPVHCVWEWRVTSFLLLFPCPCFSLTFVNSTFLCFTVLCNRTDPARLCPEIESLASHHNELDHWPWLWSLLSPCPIP